MELIAFIIMAAVAYISIITKQRAIVYLWFVLFVVYSLIVRLLPPTLDMIAYTSAVTTWPPPLIPYTLREPVIWLGGPLLHEILGDRVLTFLAVDVVSGLIVFRAMHGLDDGSGRMFALAPTIIVSYVFLMGQQNGWRQQVAFVILLWACSSRLHSQPRAIALFVLSVLTHNSMALLFGFWLDIGRRRGRTGGALITIGAVLLVAILFPYLRKSSSVTGLNTEFLYIAVAMGVVLIILYANTGRLPRPGTDALLNFAAFAPAIAVLGSTQFERMGMMFLVLILVDVYRHNGPLRMGGIEVATLVYIALVVPVFLFPNALGMLLM